MIKIYHIKSSLLVALIFLSLANTFLGLPLDKAAYTLLALAGGWLMYSRLFFSWDSIIILSLIIVGLLSSYISALIDYEAVVHDTYLLIFFLASTWLLAIFAQGNPRYFLNAFLFAAAIYLIFGLVAWLYSVATSEIFYVMPLYGKGRPDVFAALSFATTPQVYASIAALASIVALHLKKNTKSASWYNLIILVAIIAIVASLNRVWLLYVPIILMAWGGRRIALLLMVLVIPLGIALGGYLLVNSNILFALGTVSSRFMMFEYMVQFINEQSFVQLLFGNPFYTDSYFSMHDRDFFYIESAPVYLMAKFGAVGVLITTSLMMYWLFGLSKRDTMLTIFSAYYLIFVQFMTHEFFSISFWLYWVIFLCLCRLNTNSNKGLNTKKMEYRNNESSILRQA